MQRKRLSFLLAVSLIGSLLGFLPTAAQAQISATGVRNATILMPNDTYADKDQLSDAFDGQDSLAHVTAIADPRATQAEFFVCTDTTTTAGALGTNACRSIGSDTSATQPVGPSGSNENFLPGSFKAFDVFTDIPASDDNQNRNVAALVCNGAPSQDLQTVAGSQNGAPVNCRFVVERNIELDDGSTNNSGQTPALGTTGREIPTGEITGICTGSETECRPTGSAGTGTGAGTFAAFPHGTVLPTTAFSLRFRTSADVTAAGACLALLQGGSNTAEPAGTTGESSNNPAPCSIFPTGTVKTDVGTNGADNQTTYNEFTARFTALGGASRDLDVAIFGDGEDTNGECGAAAFAAGFGTGGAGGGNSGTVAGDGSGSTTLTDGDICVFDEHYAVFVAQTNQGLQLTFNESNATPQPVGTVRCGGTGDTAETNRLGTAEIVTACLTDQNGNAVPNGTVVTFESRGVGTLTCTGAGATATTPLAGPAAGDVQRCTSQTANGGRATAQLTNGAEAAGQGPTAGNRDRAPGDQTVTACVDRAITASNPVGCGTADTPTSNPVVKTWITSPDNVNLVFDDGSATTGCTGGDTFKVNEVGDTDTVLACVFDVNGNPITTQNTGNTGETQGSFSLQFFIAGGGGEEAVVFASNPPTETGANGQASVTIRAIEEGSEQVCVNLIDNTGAQPQGQACVTKTVEGADEPAVECNDGIDNDGDGKIDFGSGSNNDQGCASIDDNTEDGGGPGNQDDFTEVRRERDVEITRIAHVFLPGKDKPALLIKGRVSAPGFAECASEVPIKVQIRAGGEWITRKSDTTSENGVFKVLIRDVQARYRAIAPRFEIIDEPNETINICVKAKDTQRHGHGG